MRFGLGGEIGSKGGNWVREDSCFSCVHLTSARGILKRDFPRPKAIFRRNRLLCPILTNHKANRGIQTQSERHIELLSCSSTEKIKIDQLFQFEDYSLRKPLAYQVSCAVEMAKKCTTWAGQALKSHFGATRGGGGGEIGLYYPLGA